MLTNDQGAPLLDVNAVAKPERQKVSNSQLGVAITFRDQFVEGIDGNKDWTRNFEIRDGKVFLVRNPPSAWFFMNFDRNLEGKHLLKNPATDAPFSTFEELNAHVSDRKGHVIFESGFGPTPFAVAAENRHPPAIFTELLKHEQVKLTIPQINIALRQAITTLLTYQPLVAPGGKPGKANRPYKVDIKIWNLVFQLLINTHFPSDRQPRFLEALHEYAQPVSEYDNDIYQFYKSKTNSTIFENFKLIKILKLSLTSKISHNIQISFFDSHWLDFQKFRTRKSPGFVNSKRGLFVLRDEHIDTVFEPSTKHMLVLLKHRMDFWNRYGNGTSNFYHIPHSENELYRYMSPDALQQLTKSHWYQGQGSKLFHRPNDEINFGDQGQETKLLSLRRLPFSAFPLFGDKDQNPWNSEYTHPVYRHIAVDQLQQEIEHGMDLKTNFTVPFGRLDGVPRSFADAEKLLGLRDPSMIIGSNYWSSMGITADDWLPECKVSGDESSLRISNFVSGVEKYTDAFRSCVLSASNIVKKLRAKGVPCYGFQFITKIVEDKSGQTMSERYPRHLSEIVFKKTPGFTFNLLHSTVRLSAPELAQVCDCTSCSVVEGVPRPFDQEELRYHEDHWDRFLKNLFVEGTRFDVLEGGRQTSFVQVKKDIPTILAHVDKQNWELRNVVRDFAGVKVVSVTTWSSSSESNPDEAVSMDQGDGHQAGGDEQNGKLVTTKISTLADLKSVFQKIAFDVNQFTHRESARSRKDLEATQCWMHDLDSSDQEMSQPQTETSDAAPMDCQKEEAPPALFLTFDRPEKIVQVEKATVSTLPQHILQGQQVAPAAAAASSSSNPNSTPSDYTFRFNAESIFFYVKDETSAVTNIAEFAIKERKTDAQDNLFEVDLLARKKVADKIHQDAVRKIEFVDIVDDENVFPPEIGDKVMVIWKTTSGESQKPGVIQNIRNNKVAGRDIPEFDIKFDEKDQIFKISRSEFKICMQRRHWPTYQGSIEKFKNLDPAVAKEAADKEFQCLLDRILEMFGPRWRTQQLSDLDGVGHFLHTIQEAENPHLSSASGKVRVWCSKECFLDGIQKYSHDVTFTSSEIDLLFNILGAPDNQIAPPENPGADHNTESQPMETDSNAPSSSEQPERKILLRLLPHILASYIKHKKSLSDSELTLHHQDFPLDSTRQRELLNAAVEGVLKTYPTLDPKRPFQRHSSFQNHVESNRSPFWPPPAAQPQSLSPGYFPENREFSIVDDYPIKGCKGSNFVTEKNFESFSHADELSGQSLANVIAYLYKVHLNPETRQKVFSEWLFQDVDTLSLIRFLSPPAPFAEMVESALETDSPQHANALNIVKFVVNKLGHPAHDKVVKLAQFPAWDIFVNDKFVVNAIEQRGTVKVVEYIKESSKQRPNNQEAHRWRLSVYELKPFVDLEDVG